MRHLTISCTYFVQAAAAVCVSPLAMRVAVSYFGQILTKNPVVKRSVTVWWIVRLKDQQLSMLI